MQNFELYNPVKLIFGKGEISKLKENIPEGSRIMMIYGGGSIKKNGIYNQVISALKDFEVMEFGGIEANPEYKTLMKATIIARQEQIDFLLAVGGGSVIDGTKLIAAAIPYDGDEWDIPTQKTVPTQAIPFGTVLTIPATGSEMNNGAVISRKEIGEKMAFGSPVTFPKFSILDPTVVASLPKRQLINGVIDAYMHVLEQYLTYPVNAKIQDRISEGILQTLIEIGDKVIEQPDNYELAESLMYSATWALNGLISGGVPVDWTTHVIGHELTALYGIDHASTLAIIGPNIYTKLIDSKREKLEQYGERVFGVKTAEEAIAKTKAFFELLGAKTKLSSYTDDYEKAPAHIRSQFGKRGWFKLGEKGLVTPELVEEIVRMSF